MPDLVRKLSRGVDAARKPKVLVGSSKFTHLKMSEQEEYYKSVYGLASTKKRISSYLVLWGVSQKWMAGPIGLKIEVGVGLKIDSAKDFIKRGSELSRIERESGKKQNRRKIRSN